MESNILLTICIPTYNRKNTLEKVILSIINNKYFSEDIEVVISDNDSSDGTYEMCIQFSNSYTNIKYYRNEKNVGGDRNILLSLQRGRGLFLKLLNDYSCITDTGLGLLLNVVKNCKDKQTALFFNNTSRECCIVQKYNSLDCFVENAGWSLSWIGNHGFWKTDVDSWVKPDKNIETKFMQVDWCLRSYKKYKQIALCTMNFSCRLDTDSKQGDYNFFKVHTTNYFYLFEECVKEGSLSEKTLSILKRKVLRGLLPWVFKLYVRRDSRYSYTFNDGIKHLYSIYHQYYWAYFEIARFLVISPIRKIRNIF